MRWRRRTRSGFRSQRESQRAGGDGAAGRERWLRRRRGETATQRRGKGRWLDGNTEKPRGAKMKQIWTPSESPSSFRDVDDDDRDNDALVYLGFPSREPKKFVDIVGSCNGLICLLYCPNCFILWNPSTRDSRKLPPPPSPSPVTVRGFGRRSSLDDYKVVRAIPTFNPNQFTVEIFNLKDNSWRRIEGLREDILITKKVGTCLNGALHWFGSSGAGPSQKIQLVSLDLEDLEFQEISVPYLDNESVHFHT
ncbi:hypothetical protein U1Q18_010716 [Sarracenia purpurea var. burkii]